MEILENPTYFWSLVGVGVIILSVWLYRRAHQNAVDNALFDNMDAVYFESDPLLDEPRTEHTDPALETEINHATQATDFQDARELETATLNQEIETEEVADEKLQEFKDDIEQAKTDKPKKKSRPEPELIIALFVLPDHEDVLPDHENGFLGTDIFTVLQDQNMSYGKMEIFHHYGVGEIKVKHAIFSVANILNPGTFNPKQMEEFKSAGLVFFMQLPGAFGGRVAFELMLNTAKRVADSLEGTLTDERQYILDRNMVEALRDKISQFELEKEQFLAEN